MSLFHVHLRTAGGLNYDEVGVEGETVEAIYLDACAAIPDMARDMLRQGRNPMLCAFIICDQAGRMLMEAPFSEILRPSER